MNKHLDKAAVADVATGKKQYVPPQMELVELDNQGAILTASPHSFGAGFKGDIDEDEM